jgi:predicted small metal-binding protein
MAAVEVSWCMCCNIGINCNFICAGVANPWIMSDILLHMLTANSLNKTKILQTAIQLIKKQKNDISFLIKKENISLMKEFNN